MENGTDWRWLASRSAAWAALFAAGVAAGAALVGVLLPLFAPALQAMDQGMSQARALSENALVAGIFLKNATVVLLVVLLGKPTRGIVPALVCLQNSLLIGALASALHGAQGLAWWRFALFLAPHGVFELPAIFLACAIGMLAWPTARRLRLALVPLGLLAVAAVVEVYVTPVLGSRLI